MRCQVGDVAILVAVNDPAYSHYIGRLVEVLSVATLPVVARNGSVVNCDWWIKTIGWELNSPQFGRMREAGCYDWQLKPLRPSDESSLTEDADQTAEA